MAKRFDPKLKRSAIENGEYLVSMTVCGKHIKKGSIEMDGLATESEANEIRRMIWDLFKKS